MGGAGIPSCDRERPVGTEAWLRPILWLSEMLHDQLRDEEAGECLRQAVGTLGESKAARQAAVAMGRDVHAIESRMHYFLACHFQRTGDRDQQVARLRQARRVDPSDVDVLIAMYHVPDQDPAWRAQTVENIQTAANKLRGLIGIHRTKWQESENEIEKTVYGYRLEEALNQFAWLVGNTEGDLEEATRASHESLELAPGRGVPGQLSGAAILPPEMSRRQRSTSSRRFN